MNRRSAPRAPLWLAHHYPEDLDRCMRIGRWHICRRCAVLYPVAFAVVALAAAVGWRASGAWAVAVVVVLPLPAVVEFVGEHLGRVRHAPVRQVVLTVPLGVGLGVGFVRYLVSPADMVFWGAVLLYGGVCALVALRSARAVR